MGIKNHNASCSSVQGNGACDCLQAAWENGLVMTIGNRHAVEVSGDDRPDALVFATTAKKTLSIDELKKARAKWAAEPVLGPMCTNPAEVLTIIDTAISALLGEQLNTGDEPDTSDCAHPQTCGFCRARYTSETEQENIRAIQLQRSDEQNKEILKLRADKAALQKRIDEYGAAIKYGVHQFERLSTSFSDIYDECGMNMDGEKQAKKRAMSFGLHEINRYMNNWAQALRNAGWGVPELGVKKP